MLDKTIHILAAPPNVPLSILFIEKLIKCLLVSLSFGGVCVFIRQIKSSKNKMQSFLLIGCVSYSVYFVLAYFIYIRNLAASVTAQKLIAPLVVNQFGRMFLVIGSMFMR